MIARVDAAKCRGHGQCQAILPEIFQLGEDDKSHVIVSQVPPALAAAADDAVVMCPEGAIEVTAD